MSETTHSPTGRFCSVCNGSGLEPGIKPAVEGTTRGIPKCSACGGTGLAATERSHPPLSSNDLLTKLRWIGSIAAFKEPDIARACSDAVSEIERLDADACNERAEKESWRAIAETRTRERDEAQKLAQFECKARFDYCAYSDRLRAALERSRVALDDWLHIYAPEHCDPEYVTETTKRIGKCGIVAYIADVQRQNRSALSGEPASAHETFDGIPVKIDASLPPGAMVLHKGPTCTCGTNAGHTADCPVSIERQAQCRHEVVTGWSTVGTAGGVFGESWCQACGKKMMDYPLPPASPLKASEPPESRSVQRRMAALRDEPAPEFGPSQNGKGEP